MLLVGVPGRRISLQQFRELCQHIRCNLSFRGDLQRIPQQICVFGIVDSRLRAWRPFPPTKHSREIEGFCVFWIHISVLQGAEWTYRRGDCRQTIRADPRGIQCKKDVRFTWQISYKLYPPERESRGASRGFHMFWLIKRSEAPVECSRRPIIPLHSQGSQALFSACLRVHHGRHVRRLDHCGHAHVRRAGVHRRRPLRCQAAAHDPAHDRLQRLRAGRHPD
jgi:hypothetical protein